MPAFQEQQQTCSHSMAADSHDPQHLDSSSQREQHWDSDEEVCSCATAAHEHGGSLMPLHRVKRVWSHLCMMELVEDDCFGA